MIYSPMYAGRVRKNLECAARNRERILVMGDSDCDGITAAAILYLWLKGLGADVEAMVNERNDGYGFSPAVTQRVEAYGPDVLVVVDFGTNSHDELIRLSESVGAHVMILDHHQPSAPHGFNRRVVEVNPHRYGGHGQELCGAGIAWTVARQQCLIDLAALGTVVDRVPMTGSNVEIVRMGMKQMRHTVHPGLRHLLRSKTFIDERALGWDLGPCVNAAGRMGDAAAALNCLIERDEEKADNAARLLKSYNRKRKKIQKEVENKAREKLAGTGMTFSHVVFVEDAGEGMMGPVAGRLADETSRPVFVCTNSGEGKVKCSGRAPKGYDLHGALAKCDDVLVNWGGHQSAAGATCEIPLLDTFAERFESAIAEGPVPNFVLPVGRTETLRHIMSPGHIRELEAGAPYGVGNPEPMFEIRNLVVVKKGTMSDGLHLRLVLREGDKIADAVYWRAGIIADGLEVGGRVTVSARLRRNTWKGRNSYELELHRLEREVR